MARRGDGVRLRGKTWQLDFTHMGQRHQVRLGRNIGRTAALELATMERAKILRGEQGIGRGALSVSRGRHDPVIVAAGRARISERSRRPAPDSAAAR